VRVGVALPANGPLASSGFLRQFATTCESLGYDALWISDHMSWSADHAAARFPAWAEGKRADELIPNQYEPVATLAYLGGLTSTIRLGTAVLVLPVRNPVVLAREIATLDDLSGGRISLGVGVGGTNHADGDFAAVGLQNLRSRRGRATDEWIEVARRVWSDRVCNYRGDLIEIEEAWVFPKPVQPGGPPILIGGDSEHALERVARLADGSIVSRLAAADVESRRSDLADRSRRYDRHDVDFQLVVSQWLSIDDDEQVATDRAEQALGGVRRGGKPIAGQLGNNLIGSPARLQQIVGEYMSAGIDELLVQVVGDTEAEVLDSLHRLREHVLAPLGGVPS
jgi:probable F420-dependent oxidoreductase